jgi:hypothetical protein
MPAAAKPLTAELGRYMKDGVYSWFLSSPYEMLKKRRMFEGAETFGIAGPQGIPLI